MPKKNFDKIVTALSTRLTHLLKREALIGRSSRISGSARLMGCELHERLELLRDRLSAICEQILSAVQCEPNAFKLKPLRKSLKIATRALDRKSFKGMHDRNLYNKLILIIEELQIVRDVLQKGTTILGDAIDPDSRLDRCTPDEVAELFGKNQKGCSLVLCLHADVEIGHCLDEAWSILKGRFGWTPDPNGGPYEKQRGAKIAVHLIGMGCGLGLDPTRAGSSPPVSACDAALDARFKQSKDARANAVSVFNEIPTGYAGMEHIWCDAQKAEDLKSHMQTGFRLGERWAENARNRPVSADD